MRQGRAYADGLPVQFQAHSIARRYVALVEGVLPERGTFNTRFGRHPRDRKRFTGRGGSKKAVTHYAVIARLPGATLVEVQPETGRTHSDPRPLQRSRTPGARRSAVWTDGTPSLGPQAQRGAGTSGPARPAARLHPPHHWQELSLQAPAAARLSQRWRSCGPLSRRPSPAAAPAAAVGRSAMMLPLR